jgi:hypothetical protein
MILRLRTSVCRCTQYRAGLHTRASGSHARPWPGAGVQATGRKGVVLTIRAEACAPVSRGSLLLLPSVLQKCPIMASLLPKRRCQAVGVTPCTTAAMISSPPRASLRGAGRRCSSGRSVRLTASWTSSSSPGRPDSGGPPPKSWPQRRTTVRMTAPGAITGRCSPHSSCRRIGSRAPGNAYSRRFSG